MIGRLTRAPEIRQTPSGQSVGTFSIATNRVWADQNKQKQERVEFHNIVVWGRLAEICQQYLSKGQLVFIEGRIESRNWQDKTHPDVKHYRTEILAEKMQMGPRAGAGAGAGGKDFSDSPKDTAKGAPSDVTETIQYPGDEDVKPDDIQF
mgnify:FL=1